MSNKDKISIFDDYKNGEIIFGYYKGVAVEFSHSVENDMFTWYYSVTLNTWFKEEEIRFK